MSSTEARLDAAQRQALLQLAHDSITHGLQYGRALPVTAEDYPQALRAPRATFVTLQAHGELRGCIGTLEAHRALVTDVADNAFSAAFRDPRFPPLRPEELARLDIHISVLSPAVALSFRDEADLIAQLHPGVDGLVLSTPGHRGTFLPSVWELLPRPADFLQQLKLKAGLTADYWSSEIRVERYTAEVF